MLTKVWIRRFRSIVNVELDLGRMNFFIGANGSGKSNVLEALGVLGAAASGRVNDIRLLKRGVRRSVPRLYRCAFPEEQLCKQDQVQFLALGAKSEGGASYEAKLVPPRTSYETAWSYFAENLSNRRGEAVVLEKKVSLYSEQGRAAPRVKRLKKHSAVALMNTLRRFVIYSPSTPHLRGLIEDVQPREPLGLSGGRLPEGLHEVLAENGESPEIRENFAEVAGLIDWSGGFKAAPNLGDPDSPAAVRSPMLIEFIDRFMAPGANTLTGYDASEGALYVLFCAVLAMHAKAPPCLAIDNIDQALNPLLARELVTAVCRWTAHRKRQWLVTAHNPAVLDGIPLQDESVRLFAVARDSNGHTTVRRIDLKSIEATIREQSGTDWTLSRMWMNGLLGAVPNV